MQSRYPKMKPSKYLSTGTGLINHLTVQYWMGDGYFDLVQYFS